MNPVFIPLIFALFSLFFLPEEPNDKGFEEPNDKYLDTQSGNRDSLKVDCEVNFYKKYGVETSLLEAMSYAYIGDLNIEEVMKSNHDNIGFGFYKPSVPFIEKETGFNEKDLKTDYCANYEVMAWWLKNKAGYNGNNREDALRIYFYGSERESKLYAVDAVERILKENVSQNN